MNYLDESMPFYELLKQMMMARGMNSVGLAAICGVKPEYIDDLLYAQKIPSASFLDKMANSLQLTEKAKKLLFKIAGIRYKIPDDIMDFLRENEDIYRMVEEEMHNREERPPIL